jgi:ATP-binding cassette subfamily C (CFTR/MRP) protein 4
MPLVDGKIKIKQSTQITYAEQDPLIVTGTIQENILFGLPLQTDWYNNVCSSCCLEDDFFQMPDGDQTMLAEMGHNLSGGQKSRISLARAIYRKESEIILIDSSLSTLDSKVSSKVLKSAIFDLCADKLVIFVTHDLNQATLMD